MSLTCPHSKALRASAIVAALFGILTLFAGGRVLFGGSDPGYTVVRPVLLFNVVMGALYILTAVLIVRTGVRARALALFIAAANVVVLLSVVIMRATGGEVATQTLGAMTLRSAVWVTIAAVLVREFRHLRHPSPGTRP